MNCEDNLNGVIRARSAASRTLLRALQARKIGFSETTLAKHWLHEIKHSPEIFPFGWYQPPPHGLSVLIGTPPDFSRLCYRSLRDEVNFPGETLFEEENILYPYFSAIDRSTYMIGDHVATYYSGNNSSIKQWIKHAYILTKEIAESVKIGMKFSELYHIAADLLQSSGAKNNTFSISGGLSADFGHTVPFFTANQPKFFGGHSITNTVREISQSRKFVNASNQDAIRSPCAFTIEPQLLLEGYPMASFHLIIAVVNDRILVIERFFDLFEFFGMNSWLNVERQSELS